MQEEYASGSKAPELTFSKSSVDYTQARSTHLVSSVNMTYFVSRRPNALSCKVL